jgi:hypothetical protein
MNSGRENYIKVEIFSADMYITAICHALPNASTPPVICNNTVMEDFYNKYG